jgi:phytoene dehydrogenase-like protein
MARKIAIIGGGIAGLSTGCYGRMNGYETDIFEMHTVPGGVCTAWTRRGYTFDGCLHFLVGTAAGNSFHRVWQELGVLSGKRVVTHEVFGDVVLPDGRRLRQYADVDRMVQSLKAGLPGLAARDCARLDRLAADVKLWGTLKMPFGGPPRGTSLAARLRGIWKIRAFLPVFHRFRGTTETLAARFRHPDLRCFFRSVNPIPGMPAIISLMMFTVLHLREAGWPEGGSLELARSVARRYEELGGVIHYGARVREIIVRDGRAVGVRLEDGSEHFADEVISAADGHATLFGMLKGEYISPAMREAYRRLPLYTPLMQVSFGVKRDLSGMDLPRLSTVHPGRALRFGRTEVPWVLLNNYAFDPTMAPAGKSVITVSFLSPWNLWEDLAENRQAYRAERARILDDVTAWLQSFLPGITTDIEAADVATPLTTVRYTGNYHASYEGWRPTPATMRVKIDKRLPGLSGFSMVGQWTTPAAGLPTAAGDGRTVIQELCAQDGKEFRTTVPGEEDSSVALAAAV